MLKIRVVVWSSLLSLQGAALLGSAQRKAPCTLPHLPPSCSQLALALLSCLGLGHCGTPPLSLATFHSWPLFGTASWSFGRTHLTTEEEHFLTEELMTSLQLFKSLKRCIHKNTSVFYYLRNSCATFRSSASNFPSSTAPQFWNCLKFHMLLPVKFPGY